MNVRKRLCEANLVDVRAGAAKPTYDRQQITNGIVHIGVGAFHRAHQALAIDQLMHAGLAMDWGICGLGIRPSDEKLIDDLTAQDGLYTLIERHADGQRTVRVIGSITRAIFGPRDPDAAVEALADPGIRLVTLTITEGGYNFDRVTGEFVASDPDVAWELAGNSPPRTVFGYLCTALERRRARGIEPFTILSCDNIQGNGDVASNMVIAYAELRDPQMARWISDHVAFPNSMVDRITPVTTAEVRDEAAELIGLQDDCPVAAEPFFQWVIEDHFPTGRPPLESAGAQIVADVGPYEMMKLRLLNASHQGLCYFAHLKGFRLVHDAVADPDIEWFLRSYMYEEAIPTLRPVAGINLEEYSAELIRRFQNPYVRDTVARLCAESSDRIPKWLIPVIRDRLAHGASVEFSAAIVASWARYAEGIDETGAPIDVVDPLRTELQALAHQQRAEPRAFIANRRLFGDLADVEAFAIPYTRALERLHRDGAAATLQAMRKSERS